MDSVYGGNPKEEISIGGLRANATAFLINLSCLVGFGLFFALGALILEKENKFVRFYAKQTLALSIIIYLSVLLNFVIFIGTLIWGILILAITILQIYATVKSFLGDIFEIPFINNIVNSIFID